MNLTRFEDGPHKGFVEMICWLKENTGKEVCWNWTDGIAHFGGLIKYIDGRLWSRKAKFQEYLECRGLPMTTENISWKPLEVAE